MTIDLADLKSRLALAYPGEKLEVEANGGIQRFEVATILELIADVEQMERFCGNLSEKYRLEKESNERWEKWWREHGGEALKHYADRADKAEAENRAWARAFKQTIIPGHEGPEAVSKFIVSVITEHQNALSEARKALSAADEAMCETHNGFENWDLEGWRAERANLARTRLNEAIQKVQKALGVRSDL